MTGQNLAMEYKQGNVFKNAAGNFAPVAGIGAGVRNGAAIQRLTPGVAPGARFQGCTLGAQTGAGTFTLDAKIQTSPDGSTAWADYIPPGQAVVASLSNGPGLMTVASSIAELDVDLEGALAFIRVVETLTVAGGTPTFFPDENVVLYGADRTPPAGK